MIETKLGELVLWPVVRRNWAGRVHPNQCPAALLLDGGETAEDFRSCQVQIEIPIEIGMVVWANDHDELGPEFSARLAEIKALFMADETLGGAVTRIRYVGCDDPIDDTDDGGSPMLYTSVRFGLLIEHSETSPYT